MAKLSKRVKAFRERVDANKSYPLDEAIAILEETATAKFNESVEVAVNLGVDARKSDQGVRGATTLPHGTGSDLQTILSHDVSGNYFDFDMNLLEPGYEYAFRFAFYDPSLSSWTEQRETFKFRVEEYEY